jgi:hypothetical protein
MSIEEACSHLQGYRQGKQGDDTLIRIFDVECANASMSMTVYRRLGMSIPYLFRQAR